MSRNARCVLPGLPYHITQRGTNRQKVFFSTAHRKTYLGLIARHQEDAGVRVLAYCLMPNHVHWVVVPERLDSLAVLFRRVHGGYAQAVNAGMGRSGHLWQNRFYSCALSDRHLWIAMRYVEANPVRARLASYAAGYRWSSAAAHLGFSRDETGILDTRFWEEAGGSARWVAMHGEVELEQETHLLRRCTYSGRPFGGEEFTVQMEERFQRQWRRWGFEKAAG